MKSNEQECYHGFMKKNNQGSALTIILVLMAIALGLVIGGMWYLNTTTVAQLQKSLEETKNELAMVKSEKEQAKEDIKKAMGNVETPLGKFMLLKAFSTRAQKVLSAAAKKDIDTIIVFVQKQPEVLIQDKPQLPADVQKAVTSVKAEIAKAKIGGSAVKTSTDEDKIGTTATLQGTLTYVQDEAVLGGGMFSLVDDATGAKYYFYFDPATSETLQDTMVGKEVTISVLITGAANGMVTYDVVKGPTLVATTNTAPTTEPIQE